MESDRGRPDHRISERGARNKRVGSVNFRNLAPAGRQSQPMGGALVSQLNDNQFLVAGFYSRVDFRPNAPDKRRRFLRVEEGTYENGGLQVPSPLEWRSDRRRPGFQLRTAGPARLNHDLLT